MTEKLRERSEDVLLTQLGWEEMEARPNLPSQEGDTNTLTGSLFMPGSGIAKPLVEAL